MDGGEQVSRPLASGAQHPGAQHSGKKPKRASVAKRMVIMLLLVGLVLGAVFGFQIFKSHMIAQVMAAMANPPQTVSTTVAAQDEWQDRLEAVGSLRAVNGADLAFEVSGVARCASSRRSSTSTRCAHPLPAGWACGSPISASTSTPARRS
jgi:hypothetical protein